MASETKKAVIAALVGNSLITVSKFVAGLTTGSVAMLSEAAHSVADTFNQVFLLVGINLGNRPADEEHQFGHGKERFFWTFITALAMFFVGAFFSIYEGTSLIYDVYVGHEIHRGGTSSIAYITLAFAAAFESFSLGVAIRESIRSARRANKSIIEYLRESEDVTIKTVLFEDSAAMIGLVLALLGIWLTDLTGSRIFDGVASIIIGIVLIAVAVFLSYESRALLLGQAASAKIRQQIKDFIDSNPSIISVGDILTMHIGPEQLLLNATVQFKSELSARDIEREIESIESSLKKTLPLIDKSYIQPLMAHQPLDDDDANRDKML